MRMFLLLVLTLFSLVCQASAQAFVVVHNNPTASPNLFFSYSYPGLINQNTSWSATIPPTVQSYTGGVAGAPLPGIVSTPTNVEGFTRWERTNKVHNFSDHPDWFEVGSEVTCQVGHQSLANPNVSFSFDIKETIKISNASRPSNGTLRLEIYRVLESGLIDYETISGTSPTIEITLPDGTYYILGMPQGLGFAPIYNGPDFYAHKGEVPVLEIPLSVPLNTNGITSNSFTEINVRFSGSLNTLGDNIVRTRKYAYTLSYWPDAAPVNPDNDNDGRVIPSWHMRDSTDPSRIGFHAIQDTTNSLLELLPNAELNFFFWSLGPAYPVPTPIGAGCQWVVDVFHPLTFNQVIIVPLLGNYRFLHTSFHVPQGYGDWTFQWFGLNLDDGSIVSSKPFIISNS